MITEKQMKIVEAVAELGCNGKGLCFTHVARATELNRMRVEGSLRFVAQPGKSKYWEYICTIEEYNQCIEEMKYHYDIPKWCSYNRADKELLTVENSDYSFYEKGKFVYGQDVYVNTLTKSDVKYKFGCLSLSGKSAYILRDEGHAYVLLENLSSKPIKSKEDIELEEAKRVQVDNLVHTHSCYISSNNFRKPMVFRGLIERMQENGDLAPIKLTEEE